MPDSSPPAGSAPIAHPLVPSTGLEGSEYRSGAQAAGQPASSAVHRVGWGFIGLFALAYLGTCLVLVAPLLVTLALKVNSLVGIERAPSSLSPEWRLKPAARPGSCTIA